MPKKCDYCLEKERQCNGQEPCKVCLFRGEDCRYSGKHVDTMGKRQRTKKDIVEVSKVKTRQKPTKTPDLSPPLPAISPLLNDTNQPDIENLIQLYLLHHWPRFPMCHKSIFLELFREAVNGQNIFWLHSLLACATLYDKDAGIIGLEFASNASSTFPRIPIDPDSPESVILHVQACLNLAWFWSSKVNDIQGQIYTSMAASLALNMFHRPLQGAWKATAYMTWWMAFYTERLVAPIYGTSTYLSEPDSRGKPFPTHGNMISDEPLPLAQNFFNLSMDEADNLLVCQAQLAHFAAEVVATRRRLSSEFWLVDDDHDVVESMQMALVKWLDELPLEFRQVGSKIWTSRTEGTPCPIRFVFTQLNVNRTWWKSLDPQDTYYSTDVLNLYVYYNAVMVGLHCPTVSPTFTRDETVTSWAQSYPDWVETAHFEIVINHIVALAHFSEVRLMVKGPLGLGQEVVLLLAIACECLGGLAWLVQKDQIKKRKQMLERIILTGVETNLVKGIMSTLKIFMHLLERMGETIPFAKAVHQDCVNWQS